ncbi:zinc finger protein 830 [Salarias fasciatus]|uniref:Zinc finger protein 830 n=1 Tax=Salarias fasciatus TaxID=181472 RepID=A0A672HNL1_SALFA|nr:zinc finger protein 830 [Salarias fasciatus]
MSASKKGKKAVSQEELRRLMREKQKQKQNADKKRVQSPFAKYSGAGQLSCGLCGVAVKSELLWPAHVLGKPHKERVAELKEGKSPQVPQIPQVPQSQPAGPHKRRAPHGEDDADTGKRARAGDGASSGKSAGLSLLAGVYDDEEEEGDDEEEAQKRGADPPQQQPEAAGLPADFFDSSIPPAPAAISHSGSILKAEAPPAPQERKEMAEALPEGFFDDPVRDAKVRNVDAPKDQLDKEWEEFQKEIRQVNTKSEAIVAEDDEEGRLERQIDEIDEQIECYKRVELLRDRREVVASRRRASSRVEQEESMEVEEEEEEEEEDEEQLLGLLSRDWRAKGALA